MPRGRALNKVTLGSFEEPRPDLRRSASSGRGCCVKGLFQVNQWLCVVCCVLCVVCCVLCVVVVVVVWSSFGPLWVCFGYHLGHFGFMLASFG